MVQRRDTPAARAALARRRQRAAHSVHAEAAARQDGRPDNSNDDDDDDHHPHHHEVASGNDNDWIGRKAPPPSTAAAPSARRSEREDYGSHNGRPPVREVIGRVSSSRKALSITKRSRQDVKGSSTGGVTMATAMAAMDALSLRIAGVGGGDEESKSPSRASSSPLAQKAMKSRSARHAATTTATSSSYKGGRDHNHHASSSGNTVAGHTVDGTLTTAGLTNSTVGRSTAMRTTQTTDAESLKRHEDVLERSRLVAEQSSALIDASLIQTTLRSSGGGRLADGGQSIEAVWREGTTTVGSNQSEAGVSKSPPPQQQQEEEEKKKKHQQYERISAFGFVEVTSPQPSVPERRNESIRSYYPQPKSPTESTISRQQPRRQQQQQQKQPQRGEQQQQQQRRQVDHNQQVEHNQAQQELHLTVPRTNSTHTNKTKDGDGSAPPIEQSRPISLGTTFTEEESISNTISLPACSIYSRPTNHSSATSPPTGKPTQLAFPNGRQHFSLGTHQTIGSSRQRTDSPIGDMGPSVSLSTDAGRVSRIPDPRQVARPPAVITKASTAASVAESNTMSFRTSKIPSPPSMNPDAINLLPRRSTSPRRAAISPEKRLSPRRFGLASSGASDGGSPPSVPKALSRLPPTVVRNPESDVPRVSLTRKENGLTAASESRRKPPVAMEHGLTAGAKPPEMLSVQSKASRNTTGATPKPHVSGKGQVIDSQQLAAATKNRVSGNSATPQRRSVQDDGLQHEAWRKPPTLQPPQQHREVQVQPRTEQVVRLPLNAAQTPLQNGRTIATDSYATPNPSRKVGGNGYYTPAPTSLARTMRPNPNDLPSHDVDAACLHSGQSILLKSCGVNATLRARPNEILARIDGPGLGESEEVLQIVKVHTDQTEPQAVLNFGDSVILQSPFAKGNALGIRRKKKDVAAKDELGFFDAGKNLCDQWTILVSRPNQTLLVGKAALRAGDDPYNFVQGPATTGLHILLRNCYNGGFLTVRDGGLALMTDSYDPSQLSTSEDPTLLGRLQAHGQIIPSMAESFQLLLPMNPPCPMWTVPKSIDERVFLTGAYESMQERNELPVELDAVLFPQTCHKQYYSGRPEEVPSCTSLSATSIEKILLVEVVGSFLGLEGVHVRLENLDFHLLQNTGHFTVNLGLRRTIEQILPLPSAYVQVRNFIESHCPGYEYGRVMQAFCEALESYLHQFETFISQLENRVRKSKEAFTMKSLHFEITPLLHSMAILQHATTVARDKKGGALINAIWALEKRMYIGDTVARELFGTLLEKSSVPYVQMLSTWLQSGRLRDPFNEFMIAQSDGHKMQSNIDGDDWMSVFKIREEDVITSIIPNEATKTKILLAGKYWNAIQACAVDMDLLQGTAESKPHELTSLQFNSDSSTIAVYIDAMYQNASDNLVFLLRDKFQLTDALHLLKRYFLLDQGDFLVNFLEYAEDELQEPMDTIQVGRVQHFLAVSIQQTENQRDGDLESGVLSYCAALGTQLAPRNLRCRFSSTSLLSYLDSLYGGLADSGAEATPSRRPYGSALNRGDTGFDLFYIDFARIPFPLSLILSHHAMESYKLLFRHLFFAKHVERRLIAVWADHHILKKLDSLRGMLGRTFLLRQRMLHFVQSLMNYLTFEVVESNWLEMITSLDRSVPDPSSANGYKQQTVDNIQEIHNGFLQKTLDNCLLTNPFLIGSLTKVLNNCLLFTDQMRKFMASTRIYEDSSNLATEKSEIVHRNLNNRGISKARAEKKLHRALSALKEEREAVHHRQTRRVGREVCSESYRRMLERFDVVFSNDVSVFMVQLNTHTSSSTVANLGIRLDFNGFVSKNTANARR